MWTCPSCESRLTTKPAARLRCASCGVVWTQEHVAASEELAARKAESAEARTVRRREARQRLLARGLGKIVGWGAFLGAVIFAGRWVGSWLGPLAGVGAAVGVAALLWLRLGSPSTYARRGLLRRSESSHESHWGD